MWRKLDFFFKWNFLVVINVKIASNSVKRSGTSTQGFVVFSFSKKSYQIQEAPVIMSNCISVVFVFEMSQYYLFPPNWCTSVKIQINGCCKKEKKKGVTRNLWFNSSSYTLVIFKIFIFSGGEV